VGSKERKRVRGKRESGEEEAKKRRG